MNKIMIAALLSSTALAAVPALAQTVQTPPPQNQPQAQGAASGQQGSAQQTSAQEISAQEISAQEFVRRAGSANLMEIQTSQLALQRSQNQDVREFSQRMVKDHQNAMAGLTRAAEGMEMPTTLRGEYRSQLRELRQAGQNFDQEYVALQIDVHEDNVELFEQYARSGGNAGLQRFARQTLPALRNHLRSAEALSASASLQAQASSRAGAQTQSAQRQSGPGERPGQAQVFIQQRQPQVTVDQVRPQITVRQPAPTITIDQPQPEIIVRMPQPDVNVATQQPEVSFRMPQPRVSVNRQGEQRVRINPAEQPQVTFERLGQPRLQIRQAPGEPQIRYEQVEAGASAQGQARTGAARSGQGAAAGRAEQTGSIRRGADQASDRSWVSEASRLSGANEPASRIPAAAPRQMSVSQLLDATVYNGQGEELGEIDRVIMNEADNRRFVVLTHGGFLGLFENEAALPVERIRFENDRLVIRGLTEQDIEQMPDWETRIPNYRELEDNATLLVNVTG